MPRNAKQASELLITIHSNGFDHNDSDVHNWTPSYRISKVNLREHVFELGRLEVVTLERLRSCLKKRGYLFTPIDNQADDATSEMWVVQRIKSLRQLPEATKDIIDEAISGEDEEDEVE